MTTQTAGTITAAGTVPWRLTSRGVEVALVHRPRYDDWAWPKGKSDDGEDWATTAVRETQEETGLRVRLGRPLPTARYRVADRDKEVRYWSAEVVEEIGTPDAEVDEVRWVSPAGARDLATYDRDLSQLDALLAEGSWPTRTVLVVRHARALPRKAWKKRDDRERPLDDAGERRAEQLVPLLRAYGTARVVSSGSVRCADTVRPFLADEPGVTATWADPLSEEGFEHNPALVRGLVAAVLTQRSPVALCSHGPVLPDVYAALLDHIAPAGKDVRAALLALHSDGMAKGEVTVLHLTGDDTLTCHAVERHLP